MFVMDMDSSNYKLSRDTSVDSGNDIAISNNNSQVRFVLEDEEGSESIVKELNRSDSLQYSLEDINTSSGVEEGLSTSIENRIKVQRPLGKHSRQPSNSSSLFSVPFNENTEVYVDFASGLFAQGSFPGINMLSTRRASKNKSPLAEETEEEEGDTLTIPESESACNGMFHAESFSDKKRLLFRCIDGMRY